jgi:hypothetical protein
VKLTFEQYSKAHHLLSQKVVVNPTRDNVMSLMFSIVSDFQNHSRMGDMVKLSLDKEEVLRASNHGGCVMIEYCMNHKDLVPRLPQ